MIQTVTGAINKTDVGAVLMHEHISCASLSFSTAFGKLWLDKEKLKVLACDTLKQTARKHSLGLLVDATPIDVGRDAALLKEISLLSGVMIVASTGFYALESIETLYNSPEDIAEWFISECRNGIFGTDVKPGILKCATSKDGITKDNLKKLSAMGIVQSKTGLPLYVHCEHREEIALSQIDILSKNGARQDKIIIGHTAMRPDSNYLESILKHGCYICMDQCHCYASNLKAVTQSLVTLCEKGYANKILVSNDYCIHSDFGTYDNSGLNVGAEKHTEKFGFVFDVLHKEFLASGGNENDWNAFIYKNPITALNIV